MVKKKKIVKIKISLHRLYIYYKQLLHILHIMSTFDKTTYIVVNNQMLVPNLLEAQDLFSDGNLFFKKFKFNIVVYNYLKKNKLFNLIKLNNLFFFKNFNYILQLEITVTINFLNQLLTINSGFVQFMYLKLPLYTKLLSIVYYKDFLEKIVIKNIYYKQTRLSVFYNILFLRLLNLNLHIKNVTNNISIS